MEQKSVVCKGPQTWWSGEKVILTAKKKKKKTDCHNLWYYLNEVTFYHL